MLRAMERDAENLFAPAGSVLLSSTGNPKYLPVYWDKILINASQATPPPLPPARAYGNKRVFGKKPERPSRSK